jgi:hypothetical protein
MHDKFHRCMEFHNYGRLKHGLLCMNSSMRSKYDLLKLVGNPCMTLSFVDISDLIFIVTTIVHVISYLLVVSIERSTFVSTCCSIVKML